MKRQPPSVLSLSSETCIILTLPRHRLKPWQQLCGPALALPSHFGGGWNGSTHCPQRPWHTQPGKHLKGCRHQAGHSKARNTEIPRHRGVVDCCDGAPSCSIVMILNMWWWSTFPLQMGLNAIFHFIWMHLCHQIIQFQHFLTSSLMTCLNYASFWTMKNKPSKNSMVLSFLECSRERD